MKGCVFMNKKTTKKEYFGMLAEVVANSGVDNMQELQDFINHELELLNNKAIRKTSGETPTAKENQAIAEIVMVNLAEPKTISELLKVQELADYITIAGKNISNQKLSAICNKLVENGKLVKSTDKKITKFALAE